MADLLDFLREAFAFVALALVFAFGFAIGFFVYGGGMQYVY